MECKMELGYKLVEKLGKVLHIDKWSCSIPWKEKERILLFETHWMPFRTQLLHKMQ